MIETALFMLVGAIMIAAAAYDVLTLTIPNWISLVLIVLFPFLASAAGLGWHELGWHVAIAVIALAAGIAAFAVGAVGGGDAKLFAAVALYMGPLGIAPYVMTVALAGGVLAALFLVLHQPGIEEWMRRVPMLATIASRGAAIPYGVAIVVGGLIASTSSHLFTLASVA
ncbi:MAG: peptidase [Alphaproteobacteria bacterium]|nr:peptidase [Alphaproteobacteria bacterium]